MKDNEGKEVLGELYQIREKIYNETKNMTPDQFMIYIEKKSDKIQNLLNKPKAA